MQHELPSARLPHHSGDDAAGGLPSLGSSPKMEPKVVGRTSAEVEAAAASLHLEAYGEEEPEEMWEQMSPRVYRNLDEIFAGEYEGMRCADGAILVAQSCAQFSDPPSVHTSGTPTSSTSTRTRPSCARWTRSVNATRDPTYGQLPLPCRPPTTYFPLQATATRAASRTSTSSRASTRWSTRWSLESTTRRLLIVSHQAVRTRRCLYAYLMNLPRGQCPKLEIPLHTVMKITYDGWNPPSEERFILGPDPLEALDGEVTDERTKRGPCSPRDGQKHL